MLTSTTRRGRCGTETFEAFRDEELCAQQGSVIARKTTETIQYAGRLLVEVSLVGFKLAPGMHTYRAGRAPNLMKLNTKELAEVYVTGTWLREDTVAELTL